MLDHTTWSDTLYLSRSHCPRGSECYQLAPSHLIGSTQMAPPHTSAARSKSHLCIYFQVLGLSLCLISCLGSMFIPKSSIWPLISLLLHLLSAQSLKSRFVSWIPALANSDGCVLVKHPPLCTCLVLHSPSGTPQSLCLGP